MWRSCTTNFTQIGKTKWKERAEILILKLNLPCKMSNATYLTNFSCTKKCMKSWLDSLNRETFITSVRMAANMPIFTKPSPARNFSFFPAKNSCNKYPKNPTYRLFSNISQRQANGQTEREREKD